MGFIWIKGKESQPNIWGVFLKTYIKRTIWDFQLSSELINSPGWISKELLNGTFTSFFKRLTCLFQFQKWAQHWCFSKSSVEDEGAAAVLLHLSYFVLTRSVADNSRSVTEHKAQQLKSTRLLLILLRASDGECWWTTCICFRHHVSSLALCCRWWGCLGTWVHLGLGNQWHW